MDTSPAPLREDRELVDGRLAAAAVSPAVARLLEAVEGVVGEDLGGVPAAELGAAVVAIRRGIDRLETAAAHRLAAIDEDAWVEGSPFVSLVDWLAGVGRMSGPAAAQRVGLARRLGQLPETEAALRRGEIGFQHAAAISRMAGQVGGRAVAAVEEELVASAAVQKVDGFAEAVRALRGAAEPERLEDVADRDEALRWLEISRTSQGAGLLDGRLDPVTTTLLRTALAALMRPREKGDRRTAGERRADALGELLRGVLDGGRLPASRGIRPQLTLIAALDTLRGVPGALPAEILDLGQVPLSRALQETCDCTVSVVVDGGPVAGGARPEGMDDGLGQAGGGSVRGSLVGRAAGGGAGALRPAEPAAAGPSPPAGWSAVRGRGAPIGPELQRTLRRLAGTRLRPVAAGVGVRLVPPPLRRALEARDRHCRFPRCERPPRQCDAHHITHWLHDGTTCLDNLILLCRRHHRLHHRWGWALVMHHDGTVEAVPPKLAAAAGALSRR